MSLPDVEVTEGDLVVPPTPVSPKVFATAIASFLAPAILLVLLWLQTPEGQATFGGLPPILVILVGGLVTSAISTVSAYVKEDPLRSEGQIALEARRAKKAHPAGRSFPSTPAVE